MGFKREPLIKTRHIGPELTAMDADTDLARRLELALPYTLDTSKSFARSLIENQRAYGWSAKQREWAQRLVEQAREEYRRRHPRQGVTPAQAAMQAAEARPGSRGWPHYSGASGHSDPVMPRISNAALAKILGLFKHAGSSLKKPILRVLVANRMTNVKPGRDGGLVVFWRDTQGKEGFAGKVTDTGIVHAGNMAEAIVQALDAFADPESAAKAFAKATKSADRPHGNCCFCGLHLTDARSVRAGYGPICAANWCLPWGG